MATSRAGRAKPEDVVSAGSGATSANRSDGAVNAAGLIGWHHEEARTA